jgi:hypothetical protein
MNTVGTVANNVWFLWSLAFCIGQTGELLNMKYDSRRLELLWRAAGRVHQEVWIAVPPGVLLGTIHDWHSHTPWLVFFDALSLYVWWIYRDWPDENRWKRRGKKLKDAIAIRAGRLVVVPAR